MLESIDPRPEKTVKLMPPCSVLELLGGLIPKQERLENYSEYYRLAGTRLFPLMVTDHENKTVDYLIIASPLNGNEVNGLFHFAAPSKTFGYDTNDIRMDWTNLFNRPENAQRLAAHRRIPGWSSFENRREQVLDLIESKGKTLVPVVHLRKDEKGDIAWIFDEQTEEIASKIHAAYPEFPSESRSYLSILGPCLIAAYAPNVIKEWADTDGRRGYTDRASKSRQESTQNMGATQTLPLSIGLAADLLKTTLLRNLVDYCDSGVLPEQTESPLDQTPVANKPTIIQGIESIKVSEIFLYPTNKKYEAYEEIEPDYYKSNSIVKEFTFKFKEEKTESFPEKKPLFNKEKISKEEKIYINLAIGLLGLNLEK